MKKIWLIILVLSIISMNSYCPIKDTALESIKLTRIDWILLKAQLARITKINDISSFHLQYLNYLTKEKKISAYYLVDSNMLDNGDELRDQSFYRLEITGLAFLLSPIFSRYSPNDIEAIFHGAVIKEEEAYSVEVEYKNGEFKYTKRDIKNNNIIDTKRFSLETE